MRESDLSILFGVPALQSHLDRVEAALRAVIESGFHGLAEPSMKQIKAGGKRIRPSLSVACALFASGSGELHESTVNGAVAVECVHVGSLVHDDIIDEAPTRRNEPTIHEEYGLPVAILAGDYLLARAGMLAAGINQRVAAELAWTIDQLCDGQSRELVTWCDISRTREAALRSVAGKTGALLRASCTIGALSVEATSDVVAALADYGTAFGMAFQIIDDVLDIASTEKDLGKPVGNDLREGVYTLPTIIALERYDTDGRLRQLLATRAGTERLTEPICEEAVDCIRSTAALRNAIVDARHYASAAKDAIAKYEQFDGITLSEIPERYLDWQLTSKVDPVLRSIIL